MQIKLEDRVPEEGSPDQQKSETKFPIYKCRFDQQM
jgi:hypothetical protein